MEISKELEAALRQWVQDFSAESHHPLREVRKLVYPILDKVCSDLLLLEYEKESRELNQRRK